MEGPRFGFGESVVFAALAALGTVLFAGTASSLGSTLAPAAAALTVALSIARGRFVRPRAFARPARVEAAVAALAFAVVVLTVSRSYAGVSLAIWAFYLAQSAYFLLPAETEMHGARESAQETGGSR